MSNGELFDWGFAKAAQGTEPKAAGKQQTDAERRIDCMKRALLEIRLIPADRFREMFGWDERTCRAVAAASGGHILGTSEGYCLTIRATPEEFSAANGRIYSQARNMLRRAIREQRVRHQLVGRV
jgi:hypothetical protein